jgi:hypothetical protein
MGQVPMIRQPRLLIRQVRLPLDLELPGTPHRRRDGAGHQFQHVLVIDREGVGFGGVKADHADRAVRATKGDAQGAAKAAWNALEARPEIERRRRIPDAGAVDGDPPAQPLAERKIEPGDAFVARPRRMDDAEPVAFLIDQVEHDEARRAHTAQVVCEEVGEVVERGVAAHDLAQIAELQDLFGKGGAAPIRAVHFTLRRLGRHARDPL